MGEWGKAMEWGGGGGTRWLNRNFHTSARGRKRSINYFLLNTKQQQPFLKLDWIDELIETFPPLLFNVVELLGHQRCAYGPLIRILLH